MVVPELNRVSVWQALPSDGIDVRSYDAYSYMHKGIVRKAESTVYRVAKNYERNGQSFCLLMVTHSKKIKQIEKFLDETSEKVKGKFDGTLRTTNFMYSE